MMKDHGMKPKKLQILILSALLIMAITAMFMLKRCTKATHIYGSLIYEDKYLQVVKTADGDTLYIHKILD